MLIVIFINVLAPGELTGLSQLINMPLGTVALSYLVSNRQGISSHGSNHGHLPIKFTFPREGIGQLSREWGQHGGAQLSVVSSSSDGLWLHDHIRSSNGA